MAQRHFLVFYKYPDAHTGNSQWDASPFDVYRLAAKSVPAMAELQALIANELGARLQGSIYHVRITGITEVTRQEWDNFLVIDETDDAQARTAHPPRYPGDCIII
jgi:hypothetical protein